MTPYNPLSRRRFLSAGASVFAAPAISTRAAWGAAAHRPRPLEHVLSDETYSLRDLIESGRLNLLDSIAYHRDTLNVLGVSLNDMFFPSWEQGYLNQLRERFRATGRVLTCLIMEGNVAVADESRRRQQIDADVRKLKAAAYLGAPAVRINLGGVGSGEDDRKQGVDRCVAAFNEMLPLARDLGIRMTIENHGGVSGTVEGILAVIHRTDPRWVGSNLDFGNAPVHEDPAVFAQLAPYAYHTHAKLASFRPDGEATNADYGALLGILKRDRYPGAVSIEWEGEGDAVEGVKKTRDLIRKHWPELRNS